MPESTAFDRPIPIVYVTDLGFEEYDPADLFDLAFLFRSPEYQLVSVCLARDPDSGRRVVDALSLAASVDLPRLCDAVGLINSLRDAPGPVNIVAAGGFAVVADVLRAVPELFREKVARLFLVGGNANDYGDLETRRLPIDPRLRDHFPGRFVSEGLAENSEDESSTWGTLLTSGQGVIWLPRDVCVWRYAAPDVLRDGGVLTDFLLRELFCRHLVDYPGDRYAAAGRPVLLSALPAFLLAAKPDPFVWMRLFRAAAARVETDSRGRISELDLSSSAPNLYVVTAVDGQAVGKLLTARLRVRPLAT